MAYKGEVFRQEGETGRRRAVGHAGLEKEKPANVCQALPLGLPEKSCYNFCTCQITPVAAEALVKYGLRLEGLAFLQDGVDVMQ